MRTFVPGTMSQRYLTELKRLQDLFLAGITETQEETAYRNKCHADWVNSTAPKRVDVITQ